MIEIAPVETDAELEAWATVKSAVVPNEPVTAEQLRASHEEGRLLVLARMAGTIAGCGLTAPSHFAITYQGPLPELVTGGAVSGC